MSLPFCYAVKLTQVKLPQNPSVPLHDKDRKRKRAQEPEEPPTKCLRKRPRTSAFGDIIGQPAADSVADNKINPIAIRNERWPKEYFDQDNQTRRDFTKDNWLEKYWEPKNNINHLLARAKSTSSLRGKQSESSSADYSDQKPRDVKSAPHQDVRYETLLATKGSFMDKSKLGAIASSKSLCRTFLKTKQTFPNDSLFCNNLFKETCEIVRNKNEARVVCNILP
jgi:hypothetical protein